jgi:hypothetical protein
MGSRSHVEKQGEHFVNMHLAGDAIRQRGAIFQFLKVNKTYL